MLSADYADEIRSHPLLNFGAAIAKEFHADIKGFDTFKQGTRADEIFQDAVRMQLTHHLGEWLVCNHVPLLRFLSLLKELLIG